MTIDIKDYNLGTPLLRPEFIRIPQRMIPPTIMTKHNLKPYLHHDSIMVQVVSDHLILSRYVCSNIVANIVTNIYMYVMRHVRT